MFAGGLLATSRVEVLWHGYLTYGIGAGLGGGLFVAPLFAAVAGWFDRYRAIAQGVTAAGNGLGILILLPLANRLIENLGWRETYVVLAAVCAVTFGLGGLAITRPPVTRRPQAGRHLRAVLTTPTFRRLAIGSAMASASQSSAFAFTILFATDAGVTSARAALLVGIIGAASIAGRLALTGLAGRGNPVQVLQVCFFGQPIAFVIFALAVLDGRADYRLLTAYAVPLLAMIAVGAVGSLYLLRLDPDPVDLS